MSKKLLLLLPVMLLAACSPTTDAADSKIDDSNQSQESGEGSNQSQESGEKTMTRAELSGVYKDTASAALTKLGYSQTKSIKRSVTVPDVGVELDPSTTNAKVLKANAVAMVALINMVGDLYLNESFAITENIVEFVVNANFGSGASDYTFQLLPSLDVANDKVLLEMAISGTNMDVYYHMDVSYDFDTKVLDSYKFSLYVGDSQYNAQRLASDGKLYLAYNELTGITQAFKDAVDQLKAEFTAKLASKVTLTADFSAEFNAYSTKSQEIAMEVMAS